MVTDLRRSHFSRAGHNSLCEGVQQYQPQQSILACLLLQLCVQVTQNPCTSTALLLDTWCGCLTEAACEPHILILSLQHSDLPLLGTWNCPGENWQHCMEEGMAQGFPAVSEKNPITFFSWASVHEFASDLPRIPNPPTSSTGLPYWCFREVWTQTLVITFINSLKIVGGVRVGGFIHREK